MTNKTRYFKNCMAVFQGGGVKALSFVGAYKEAYERGAYFSEIAGTSAGSIFAAFIAAGAKPDQLLNIIQTTDFNNFKSNPDSGYCKHGSKYMKCLSYILPNGLNNFTKYMSCFGLYSSDWIEDWVDIKLKELLNITHRGPVTFGELNIPLHVVATDIKNHKPKVWNAINDESASVAYAIRCSCTIPIYFQPVEKQYVDGGILSNLPSFTLKQDSNSNYERILCFTLSPDNPDSDFNITTYTKSIVSTIIDGAVDIQTSLQQDLYQIEIDNVGLGTVDFDKIDTDSINTAIDAGADASKSFFDSEITRICDSETHGNISKTPTQTLNRIVLSDLNGIDEITILNNDCKMVYKLFPTFYKWSSQNKTINFITSNELDKTNRDHEIFRRFLLSRLNVNLIEIDDIPFDGVLFTSKNSRDNIALIENSAVAEGHLIGHSTMYTGLTDGAAIDALISMVKIAAPDITKQHDSKTDNIQVSKADEDDLIAKLRKIKQYASTDIKISFQEVNIDQILYLTRYIKSYKYNQISNIFELYSSNSCKYFESISIDYDAVKMHVTPPILEKHNNMYFLIEGNSRLTYCHKELKMKQIYAVVVENVSHPLPTTGSYPIDKVIISDTNKIGPDRYEDFNYKEFRWIEAAVRDPSIYIS